MTMEGDREADSEADCVGTFIRTRGRCAFTKGNGTALSAPPRLQATRIKGTTKAAFIGPAAVRFSLQTTSGEGFSASLVDHG